MIFIKSLSAAAVLALIAYFTIPDAMGAQLGMVIGLLLGSVVGVIVTNSASGTAASSSRPKKSSKTGESTTLYVGNLAFRASRHELQKLFEEYGAVNSVRIMTDRVTRKPRGFGFVEMDDKGAKAATKALNGFEFAGRNLRINEANDRKAEDAQAA